MTYVGASKVSLTCRDKNEGTGTHILGPINLSDLYSGIAFNRPAGIWVSRFPQKKE